MSDHPDSEREHSEPRIDSLAKLLTALPSSDQRRNVIAQLLAVAVSIARSESDGVAMISLEHGGDGVRELLWMNPRTSSPREGFELSGRLHSLANHLAEFAHDGEGSGEDHHGHGCEHDPVKDKNKIN